MLGAVSGGVLPAPCRGGTAAGIVHIADWHATFAFLAGVQINATGIACHNRWHLLNPMRGDTLTTLHA